MNIPLFDQSRKNEPNAYGESVRLSNELRAKSAKTIVDSFGIRRDIPAKWGFDCETSPYSDFIRWLNDNTIKKSESLFWFTIRIMVIRFPEKHNEIKSRLSDARKTEFDFIISEMKNEMEWVGKVGYQNQVHLNPQSPLNNKQIRIIRLNNDKFRTEKR